MNKDFYIQIINSGQLITALLIVGAALWLLVFKFLNEEKGRHKWVK